MREGGQQRRNEPRARRNSKKETHLVGSGTLSILSSTLSLVPDLVESSLIMSTLGLLSSGDGSVLALRLELLLLLVDLSLRLLRLLTDLSSCSGVSVSVGVDGSGRDGSLGVVNDWRRWRRLAEEEKGRRDKTRRKENPAHSCDQRC